LKMSEMADRCRYVVIGGLPEPSGGVTVFNGDLVEMLLQRGHQVIVFDQNVGAKQSRFALADIRVWSRKPVWLFHVWVSIALTSLTADRVILHTSNTSGLLRIIVPIIRGVRCAVFLHNGQVEAESTSFLARSIFRWLMAHVDHVFVMSAKQKNRLSENGYPIDCLCQIVPVLQRASYIHRNHELLRDRPMVIVACGHETRVYNYEYAVRVVQELPDAELHLYFYGTPIDPGYLDDLRALDTKCRIRVKRNQDREAFLFGLSNARLFVRPNHIDSYGVSVVDALQMGTPVVASDVCDRAEGALLFAAGDYDVFHKKVLEALAIDHLPSMSNTTIDDTYRLIKTMIDKDEDIKFDALADKPSV
jgi:glycosyltransferase involved in cell wall biosynthesis